MIIDNEGNNDWLPYRLWIRVVGARSFVAGTLTQKTARAQGT